MVDTIIESNRVIAAPREAGLADESKRPMLIWGEPEKAERVLLAVHGFADRAWTFGRLATDLTRKNADLLVIAYDQQSFGRTAKLDASWPGADELVKDLKRVYDEIVDTYKVRTIFVLGHSMGAAVVVRAFTKEEHGDPTLGWPKIRPKGLILAAPAICSTANVGYLDTFLINIFGYAFSEAMVPTIEGFGVGLTSQTKDETLIEEALTDSSGFQQHVPFEKALDSRHLYDDAARRYKNIELPTLVIQGVEDIVIDARLVADHIRRFEDAHPPGTSRWFKAAYFEGRGHQLISEFGLPEYVRKEGNRVYDVINEFLSKGQDLSWIKDRSLEWTASKAEKARWATSLVRCTP